MTVVASPRYNGKRATRATEEFEAMPPHLRECVHEFGQPIVAACLKYNVRNPSHIRDLVREIWNGARMPAQRPKGVAGLLAKLDWVLLQADCPVNAKALLRLLHDYHFTILSLEPSREMIEASIDAVNHMGRVTKWEKHQNRLKAALMAGAKTFWPHLFD